MQREIDLATDRITLLEMQLEALQLAVKPLLDALEAERKRNLALEDYQRQLWEMQKEMMETQSIKQYIAPPPFGKTTITTSPFYGQGTTTSGTPPAEEGSFIDKVKRWL